MMRRQFAKLCAIVLVVAMMLCMLASCAGEQGPAGPKGEQGLQGVQGPQGEKGETGAQGPQGEKGETGAQGPQGEKGEKGDKGDKGDAGLPGLPGLPGVPGAQGPKGDKGDKGDTGAPGAQGPQGEKGETGKIGFFVSTYAQLKAASKVSNSYIILLDDIECVEPFVLTDETVTLNLNGYAIDGNAQIKVPVSAPVKNGENNLSEEEVWISAGGNSAEVPAGAKLKEGVNELVFSVVPVEEPVNSGVVAVGSEAISYEIDVAGLAADNEKFVFVDVKLAPGLVGVQVYHEGAAMGALNSGNENGEFAYDAGNGVLTIKTKSFSQFDIVHYPYDAKIGDVFYASLKDAIDAVPAGGDKPTVITMLRDVKDAAGMSVSGGKNFIVDFAGHTYELNKPGAGSTGTETIGFQFLKDSNILLKNGTITISKDNLTPATSGKNIMRIIQNYSALELRDMTIDGTNQYGGASYVMSFNNDPVLITGNTNIIAAEGEVAFDADGNWGSYNRSQVTINTTGTIVGNIEVGQGCLEIQNANVKGGVVLCTDCGEAETEGQADRISIKGGAFTDLASAIQYAADGATIKLAQNVTGPGIIVSSGKNITVDFNGYTYEIDGNLVGSSGTETNGLQLLKDSTITFKNGTLTSSNSKYASQILIQNYSNLTLDNMIVSAGAPFDYIVSNNNGNVVIKDTTINAAAGKVAFDVCRYASYTGPSVTVEGKSVINGKVEISSSGAKEGAVHQLNVTGGTFNGEIYKSGESPDFVGNITGGVFAADPTAFCAKGYCALQEADGLYHVVEVSNVVE